MKHYAFWMPVLLALCLVAAGCAGRPTATSVPPTPEDKMIPSGTPASRSVGGSTAVPAATPGVPLRLSEGREQPAAQSPAATAPAVALADADLQRVLARLPAPTAQSGDATEFALPAASLPAPRPGQTIQEPFPPPTAPPAPTAAAAGPLEVLRFQPEGDVPLAPYLSLTFNQPMVALTGIQDLAAQAVPVKLAPLPSGAWRWVGTQTLLFEPQGGRFAMATRYAVEVPAGATSATGGKLAAAVTFSFTTPPPQMQSSYPANSSQRRDVLMAATFDQRIDPAAVLATVKVRAKGSEIKLRLATADEVAADKAVRSLTERAGADRWLVFRSVEPLPGDATVDVSIGPGTPSAEGPLKTAATQPFTFKTYGPLAVKSQRCGWDAKNCPPLAPWSVEFNNSLDSDAFSDELITITPALPGMQARVYGQTLEIKGRSQGRTTYTVRLAAGLRDQFGQTLGREQALTFNVGSADPAFSAPGGNFMVLDPSAKPTYSVYTINYERLKVRAYAVTPDDWAAFRTYLREADRTNSTATPPGRKVLDKSVAIKAKTDEMVETAIDLAEALPGGLGHLVLIVEPEIGTLSSLLRPGQRVPVARTWLQATRIGLDAAVDADAMLAWANALSDGAPLAGVQFSFSPAGGSATTDARGIARLPLPSGSAAATLIARQGQDVAFLPANTYYWGEGGWQRRPVADELRWYVFDDRHLYRPGEDVHVKGWLRRVGGGTGGDVGLPGGVVGQVSYRLRDSRGNEILAGSARANALGGFDFAFTLKPGMNLGDAVLELWSDGPSDIANRRYNHVIAVQEFRRPEFEVKTSAGEGPFLVGGSADVTVAATYYAGGGLPNADVTWRVGGQIGTFNPPGWADFTFGIWTPWWRFQTFGVSPTSKVSGSRSGETSETFTGKTDATGVHRLRLDFGPTEPPQPRVYTAEASVMDVNRQAWTSSANVLVHPAALYVGLRSERIFVQREQPLKVDIIVTDLDGKPVASRPVSLRAARLDWQLKGGTWQEVEVAAQPCTVQSAAMAVQCSFETPNGGTYRISATVTDEQGRRNYSELTRWVSGGSRPAARQVEQEEVTLIPDRKEYRPGDSAEILVQAPFYPAEGLLTLRRSGLVSSERFRMDGPTTTIKVPIVEGYIPNITVQVDLVGAAGRSDDAGAAASQPTLPKRPAYATGELNLSVPPLARTLSVVAVPRDAKLEPGGKTVVVVTVKDAAGKPVAGAELAVVVVDEAVLALTGYRLADPLAVFYSQRPGDVSDYHLRANIVLANPEDLAQMAQMVPEAPAMAAMPSAMATMAPAARSMEKLGAGAADAAAAPSPIAVRSDFNALATFAPAVPTDAQGVAQVEVKLPDNLTRYRVMVVAVAGGKNFGQGESAITARLPLMVRPSPPRFLNFGDKFELPVVVQNQTDAALTVDVAARGTNIMLGQTFRVSETLKVSEAGKRVTVPANDRVEVRFPATTVSAGTARFQVAAASGAWADAASFELPVWTPATTEAFAVYGVIDQGSIAQLVIAPSNVFTQFGGLEISTSSTALQALTDAVLYLVAYPFECSEQLASRILSVAALRDVLTAFRAEGLPAPKEIEAAVARDIERLKGMQNSDGGFGVWRKGDESWPYHSIHVANALQRAKAKGYAVPADMLQRSQAYLRTVEQRYPSWYSEDVRRTLTAYALNVRKQMGDADPARARRLVSEAGGAEKLSFEALGWLLPVLSDDPSAKEEVVAIRRHLANRVTETAGTAHFITSYGDQGYVLLHSNRRADGILLDALIGDQPNSDLIPKIVKGLLANRVAGRWGNTQENVFILLAMDRYFNTYEAQTPDFVARVWLGATYAGDATFRGRTTEYREINVPMSFLANVPGTSQVPGTSNLILSKDGAGRLYYRLGLRYAPTDLNLPPYEAGFTVQRSYEAVDDPTDVWRTKDGVWHVRAGARVRVRLTMVAPARRYHVALVDPLPAGLEALNPALATTGSLPKDPKSQSSPYWWWRRTWYEHQNLRDARVEAFASLLWEGVHTYTYVARATTPGTFVVPPAKAEEMYAPETFGRSGVDRVVVE